MALALCAAEILTLTAFAMFPALQTVLRAEWDFSNTTAGWISGIYYVGYTLAVPLLTGLTDHVDPRRVWLASAGLTSLAALAFATVADGVGVALVCQLLAGIGLAGTYMPGLKLMADAIEGPRQARFVAFYTTSFTIGSAISFYSLGALADVFDWRTAVCLASAGPALAVLLVTAAVPGHPSRGFDWSALWALDFRPVLRAGRSMRIIFTYAAHMWELFAYRAWLVPYLVFCDRLRGAAGAVRPTTVAAFVLLIGVASSIAGNELSSRFGRRNVVAGVMALGVTLCVMVGLASQFPWPLLVAACAAYGVVVTADSAALTSGVIATAPPEVRGATMALHSMLGFGGAFAGSLVVGAVLDALGGQTAQSWLVAFIVMGLPGLAGILMIRRNTT
jgi:MFS family permease